MTLRAWWRGWSEAVAWFVAGLGFATFVIFCAWRDYEDCRRGCPRVHLGTMSARCDCTLPAPPPSCCPAWCAP